MTDYPGNPSASPFRTCLSGGLRAAALGASLACLLLAGCAGEPTIQTGENAETVMGTLNKVDNARADLDYVDPTIDYGRYSKLLILPLDVDNIEIVQPPKSTSMVNRFNKEWELTDDDKQKLQDAFRDATEEQLPAGGAFQLTDARGDDVLVIEAMITSIAPSGPKDDVASRGTGRARVYTSGAGGMSIAVMFADGDSGEVVALVKDTRSSANSTSWGTWGQNNSVSNMAEVRRDFNAWARSIHDGLLSLSERAATP
jgi:hypothetical protein